MQKVIIILLSILLIVVLGMVGYYVYQTNKIQNMSEQGLSEKAGFIVHLPKIIPEGYELESYEIDEQPYSETKILTLIYGDTDSNTITVTQFPVTTDEVGNNYFISDTLKAYANFETKELNINNYHAIIGAVPSPTADDTLDKLVTWNSLNSHFNVWLNNPEALTDEILIRFAESI